MRLALGFAAAGLFAGCAAGPAEFAPAKTENARVEWRAAGGAGAAPAKLEWGRGSDVRLTVGRGPLLVLTRHGGVWRARGRMPAGSWPVFVEAWEGAAYAPAGESEVRTARFVVRYRRTGPRWEGFEMVEIATGDRFRAGGAAD